MLTVLCVLRPSRIYTDDYVQNLRLSVWHHLRSPHNFVCLTDHDIQGIRTEPLFYDWPGWWAKAEMFRPDLKKLGRILYIDLDTLITGDLTPFAALSGPPIVTRDFIHGGPSQSVLNYEASQFDHVWHEFIKDPQMWMKDGDRMVPPHFGDQVLMTKNTHPFEFKYWQDVAPGKLVSYSQDCVESQLRSALPDGAAMVSFHGRVKPHNAPAWVREQWSRF